MKKILFLAALPLVFGALSTLTPSLSVHAADAVDTTPNFDEDFDEYSTTGTGEQLASKWTNGYFEKTGDNNETACNLERFSVQKDPTNAANTCLLIDTETPNESFFYLTMKGIFVKNFTLTYDYYPLYSSGAPWAGITCRKPVDGRYNGVTNVMLDHRLWSADSISPDFYRSVDDSQTSVAMTGYDGTGSASGYGPGVDGFAGVNQTWLHIKFEVSEANFALSINGHGLAKAVVNKATALHYGLVSLVSCVNKGYFDNIHLENLDTEPYTPSSSSSGTAIQAPSVDPSQYSIHENEDAVISVNTYGEKITSLKMGANEVLSKYYTLAGTSLTMGKEYLASLGTGTFNFTLTTAGGTVGFKLTIASTATSSASSSSNAASSSTSSSSNKGNGGCGGTIAGGVALSLLTLSGVGVLFFHKKHLR